MLPAGASIGRLFLVRPVHLQTGLSANTRRGSSTVSWLIFSALVRRQFRPIILSFQATLENRSAIASTVAPYVLPGWLSGQWVIGVGRSMKVTQMHVRIAAFPSEGTWDPANPSDYTPPFATMDFWLEWWLPAGYFGGNKVLAPMASRFFLGHRETKGVLNVVDMPRACGRRSRFQPVCGAPSASPTRTVPRLGVIGPISFYVLECDTNQGIDLAGNPSADEFGRKSRLDHDQQLAAKYHDPFARINPTSPGPWEYKGSTTTNSLDRGEDMMTMRVPLR